MAGWFHNGVCYAEQSQAIDTHFQAIQPAITHTPTETVKTQYVKQIDQTWVLVTQKLDSTGSITQSYSLTVAQPVFTECESPNDKTTNFLNGMELGWAVATVMLIVFCIRRSYRGF